MQFRARIAAFRLLLWPVLLLATAGVMAVDDYASRRDAMIRDVKAMARDSGPFTGRPRLDERVLQALARVPRHEFVPAEMARHAYLNRALPIGHGQTISQPYIVALMTDLADLQPGEKVLEVGTGSGYQAAILAELGVEVYSIEILQPLAEEAHARLRRLGYTDLHLRIGDGYAGWPEAAPFDAILVTAAPEDVPQPLIDQLAVGGRMVIPVGPLGQTQTLKVIEKEADGAIVERGIIPVGFVPLIRGDDTELPQ